MICDQFGNMKTDNIDCSTCPQCQDCTEETLHRTERERELYNKAISITPKKPLDLQCKMTIEGNNVLLRIPLEGLVEIWLKKHQVGGSNDSQGNTNL